LSAVRRPSAADPAPAGAGAPVRVRYFAGARAAAGVAEESVPAGLDLAQILGELATRRGARLAAVLSAATFLVDGLTCHDRRTVPPPGGTVDVLPPFAGG